MSTYTPGPWLQSHRRTKDGMYSTQVYTPDGETIATLHWYPKPVDENGSIGTYREANACLIAEAPELLKACEEFVRKCDSGEAKSIRSYAQMKAAIAKARGGQ